MRINLGCGPIQPEGWINIDHDLAVTLGAESLNAQRGDIVEGIPWIDDDSVDYVVMNHSLQQITHHDLPKAIAEIRRILVPDGILRVLVPDIFEAFRAFERGDRAWFPNWRGPDGAVRDLSVVFSEYVTWYGTNVAAFTFGYLVDRIEAGGLHWPVPVRPGETTGDDPSICELDDRGGESIIVEARK